MHNNQDISEKKLRLKETVERVMKLRKYPSPFIDGLQSEQMETKIPPLDPRKMSSEEEKLSIDGKSGNANTLWNSRTGH